MNYQQLCLDIFGTDDETELREIAKNFLAKNPRNAGRKKKYTNSDIDEMRRLQNSGVSVNEIARKYNCSRQQIARYLTDPVHPGCTLRMTYMYKTTPCTVIDVDFLKQKIFIQNKTDDLLHRAFGIIDDPTWEDFEFFLKDRCFSPARGDIKQILKRNGLDSYDSLSLLEKYSGRFAEDNMWIRFNYSERTSE